MSWKAVKEFLDVFIYTKDVLFNPRDNTKDAKDPLKYLLNLCIIGTLLSVLSLSLPKVNILAIPIYLVVVIVLFLVGFTMFIEIYGRILHVFGKVLKVFEKQNFEQKKKQLPILLHLGLFSCGLH